MPTTTDSSKTSTTRKWRLLPTAGLLCAALLSAGVLALAGCANAVNSRGGAIDSGGGSSGGGSGSSGASSGNTTRNGRGGLVAARLLRKSRARTAAATALASA